jgi:hypothetical protein
MIANGQRDARCCPECGTRGIMPLDQPRDRRGRIRSPLMLCPQCEQEFVAEGFTYIAFPTKGRGRNPEGFSS